MEESSDLSRTKWVCRKRNVLNTCMWWFLPCRRYCKQHFEATCAKLLRCWMAIANGTVLGSWSSRPSVFHRDCKTLACNVCSVPKQITRSSATESTTQVRTVTEIPLCHFSCRLSLISKVLILFLKGVYSLWVGRKEKGFSMYGVRLCLYELVVYH